MKHVLCVCIGNSDRSPLMAGVLEMYLRNAGKADVICESAGVGPSAGSGGTASKFAVAAAKNIGIDLSEHQRRQTTEIDLSQYDLIVCATPDIAAMVIEHGAEMRKVYNAQIDNPWPVQFKEEFESTFEKVLGRMGIVVQRYFSS